MSSSLPSPCLKSRKDLLHELSPYDRLAKGYDLRHFMTIARGSATELETQFLICQRLHYMTEEEIRPCMMLLDEIIRMLTVLSIRGKAD